MGTNMGKQATEFLGSRMNNDVDMEKHGEIASENDLKLLNMSAEEMQHQFDDIYDRSNSILSSLVKNPCKELEQRITTCLENNPLQMGNCFNAMNSYQAYVTEDMSTEMLERVAMIKEN